MLGVFAALVLVSAGFQAESHAFGFRGPVLGPFNEEGGGMFFQFLERIVELKLTPEQQEKILEVLKRHRSAFQDAFQRLGEAHKKLGDIIVQDNATEAAVREAHKAVSAAQEELAVLRMKVRREVMTLLTQEQKAKVEAWMQEREAGPLGRGFPLPKRSNP